MHNHRIGKSEVACTLEPLKLRHFQEISQSKATALPPIGVGFTRCNWEESVVQDRKASNEGEKVPRFFVRVT